MATTKAEKIVGVGSCRVLIRRQVPTRGQPQRHGAGTSGELGEVILAREEKRLIRKEMYKMETIKTGKKNKLGEQTAGTMGSVRTNTTHKNLSEAQ